MKLCIWLSINIVFHNSTIISHLEPFNIRIRSGHFTFKSCPFFLFCTDIQDGFGDHCRRFCRTNILVRMEQGWLVTVWQADDADLSPVTINLADTCIPSAWKATVPASSIFRLDKVKECFFPKAVMRQLPPDFNLCPSLVQVPSTSAWLSSTSRVTVSVSCALVSVNFLTTWIFFTEVGRRALSPDMHAGFCNTTWKQQWIFHIVY